MGTEEKRITRKKAIGWMGLVSLFTTVGGAITRHKKSASPKSVKMLTEDGQLVEIDAALIAVNRRKVSDEELQNWVKRK